MAESVESKVHICEECGSWTNEAVPLDVLLADPPEGWGWVREIIDNLDDYAALFCPECI